MIPSDIRLYTWVDVEEVLLRIQEQGSLPEWLIWVRAYWDSLTIGICPGTQAQAKDWLLSVYDPRLRINPEDNMVDGLIILESLPEIEQVLPVILEETEERPPVPRLVPSLARSGVLVPHRQYPELPPSFTSDFPPIVAFHSFKGGVGRTTNALASARFVIAALSDFRGQIQSRDLVRLLHLAAKESVNDHRYSDRILIPTAIKGALPECSIEKISDIELENTALKDVFTKLRDLFEEERKIPFTRDQLRLSIQEMKILEDNGVVIREKDDYYMPEIFRLGLGFSLTATGRPAVMSLARRAAKQGI